MLANTDLLQIWSDDVLSEERLGISCFVYQGVGPETLTQDIDVVHLQTLEKRALKAVLQCSGDHWYPLQQTNNFILL